MTSQKQTKSKRPSLFAMLPVILFLGLAGLFFLQLVSGRNNSDVPSALIGKSVPTFELASLEGATLPSFSSDSPKDNKLTLINVWASWCAPCRAEHPFVEALSKNENLTIYGLNYKDTDENALAFLKELGNPYDAVGADHSGRVGIDFGVYGVPETFMIDKSGTIVHKFIGPITASRLQDELVPAIERALSQK
ncbi:MAG: DsbE family thiol:disulfide interchange protein [Hyphomicrobiales bacterium]